MPSAWQALRRGESVRERRRQLERAHERFVDLLPTAGTPSDAHEAELRARFGGAQDLRPIVLESWLRSRRGTIDPDRVLDRPALDDAALEELRATHPIARVLPVMRRLLFDEARDAGMIVAVGDAAGRLLWVDGDAQLQDRAGEMGFRAGMDWSERSVGTSAPGSALALDHAIQVLGAEHFSRAVHEWSCTAAPVHDPQTGAIIGVVDVTGGDAAASPHMLPLLQATLAAVEAELQLESLRMLLGQGRGSCMDMPARPLSAAAPPTPPRGSAAAAPDPALRDHVPVPAAGLAVAAPDAAGAADPAPQFVPRLLVLGQDPARLEWDSGAAAVTSRHAEILLALSAAPRGCTATALAEQVYGSRDAEQTLRAELVRLRRWLREEGVPLTLASRPYRLAEALRVDATDTLDALDRGAGHAGFAAYSGPVLPASSAPVAERLRAEVDATLREAMLEFASPDALYDYAQHWADADAHVWETLLLVLPRTSPKRARVVARIEALSRTGA